MRERRLWLNLWMREFHKEKLIEQIDFRRRVLLVQDVFNALKDHKRTQKAGKELQESRIQLLAL